MAKENFYRTYTMKCGKMGHQGFEIGNTSSSIEDCLHISFSIEKSTSETPNDAKVRIWNLSPDNLKILDTTDCAVELKAGYDGVNPLVLVGTISSVVTTKDNADRLTELAVVDGMVELRDTNISVSMNGTVNSKDVYKMIASKMGLPIVFASDLTFSNMPNGFSFVGNGKNALQKMAKANEQSWSIQNQVIQITWPGRAVSTKGYLLNSDTGLVNTPKRISINTGTKTETAVTGWEVEYFLNGAIGINDIVRVESTTVNGYYLVHKITMDGDNMEGDWTCTAQVLEIKADTKKDKKSQSSSENVASGGTEATDIKKGDKVNVTRTTKSGSKTKGYQYFGGMFTCYYSVYDVISVKGDMVVIGIDSTVTAAVKKADIAKA